MKVEIKQIAEEKDDVFLLIRCCKPRQKQTPIPRCGRGKLNKDNELFQRYAEEHRQDMREFWKITLKLHLGVAHLSQEGVGES